MDGGDNLTSNYPQLRGLYLANPEVYLPAGKYPIFVFLFSFYYSYRI